MLDKMESVVFIKGNERYIGSVLGCEKDYFWLLVPDLRNVYVGHPDRVFKKDGTNYFEVFDHCQPINKILNKNSDAIDSYIFKYSRNPEDMIAILKMVKTIQAT